MTISGLLDMSYYNIGGNGASALVKGQGVSTIVGSATSAINFNVVEDLGGGLRGQVFVALDPRTFAMDGAGGAVAAPGINRHETFIGLTGAFGQIRLGAVNGASLGASGAGSVLGTATGSGYGLGDLAAGGMIRTARGLRYDTPRVNGFAASLNFAPGNDDAAPIANALTGPGVAGIVTAPGQQITDLGLSYSQGPLNISFSNLQRSALTGGNASQGKSTYNSIGANFTTGALRVFASYGKGDNSSQAPSSGGMTALVTTTGGLDTTLTRVGAQYTAGKVALLGSYTTVGIGTAADRKITGLRADYSLSRRTAAYAAYEGYDHGADVGTGLGKKINTMAVGVRHSF